MQTTFTRTLLSAAISLGLSLSAFAAKVPEGTQLAEKQEVTINNGAEPQSFDPHKIEGKPESQIAYQLFEGLVTKDSEGNPQPGVAESWSSTPDNKIWTFKLRKDAKWSDGSPVTAHDFVYAWQRLVDPNTASPYASYLKYLPIVNAQDVIEGKKKTSELGVKAADDHTFIFELTSNVPYAHLLTTHSALLPVHKATIEKFGDAWAKKGNFVGNGAYTLNDHVINEKIVFERNKNYWNDKETVINKATFLAIANATTDVARYRAGELDMTSYALPPEQFPKLKQEIPNEVFTPRTLSTYMYEMNLTRKPFNDVRVRKALNLALDRNVITDKVLAQGQTPTYVFTPTYITDGQKIQQPAYAQQPMAERKAEAIKLLNEAGFSKDKPLEFKILYNTSENHKKVAIAAASLFKANTDGIVNVTLENQEWKSYLESRGNKQYDVARAGWAADYNQASTFANYLTSKASNNKTGYASAAYDAAVEESYKANNAEERAAAYAKAETVLAEDAAIIPVYNYVAPRLVKPYVKGFEGKDPQDDILLRNLYLIKQ